MLKKYKTKQDERQEVQNKPIEESKITFSDYERFMEKLEQDGRLDVLEQQNPKARAYQIEQEWQKRQKDAVKNI